MKIIHEVDLYLSIYGITIAVNTLIIKINVVDIMSFSYVYISITIAHNLC